MTMKLKNIIYNIFKNIMAMIIKKIWLNQSQSYDQKVNQQLL